MSQDIYAIIGNTDRQLDPQDQLHYQNDFSALVNSHAKKIWGEWRSDQKSRYQNMCISFLCEKANLETLKLELATLAKRYNQDAIAWSPVEKTDLIKGV